MVSSHGGCDTRLLGFSVHRDWEGRPQRLSPHERQAFGLVEASVLNNHDEDFYDGDFSVVSRAGMEASDLHTEGNGRKVTRLAPYSGYRGYRERMEACSKLRERKIEQHPVMRFGYPNLSANAA